MQRIAFKMKLKPEKVEEYIEAHQHVPSDLIDLYHSAGIRNLTVFLRGSELFLSLQCDDFQAAQRRFENHPAEKRWQDQMTELMDTDSDLQPGEELAFFREVFHMD